MSRSGTVNGFFANFAHGDPTVSRTPSLNLERILPPARFTFSSHLPEIRLKPRKIKHLEISMNGFTGVSAAPCTD
jgi:hypothetical protein